MAATSSRMAVSEG